MYVTRIEGSIHKLVDLTQWTSFIQPLAPNELWLTARGVIKLERVIQNHTYHLYTKSKKKMAIHQQRKQTNQIINWLGQILCFVFV